MGQTSSDTRNFFTNDGNNFNPIGDSIGTNRTAGRSFKHPAAALFHVGFKILAFLFYLFGGLFNQDFISTFVGVILLISCDFWVVKNVTGRLLAGLRWSNYIDDEGNSHWIFENKNANANQTSKDNLSSFQLEANSSDASIFWSALIIAPMFWLLLMFVSIFRLNIQWFMLVSLAFILSASNLYGYFRCRLGSTDIKSSVTQFVAKQVFYNFITGGSSSNKPEA